MSDYPMLISNKLHSFRNFRLQRYNKQQTNGSQREILSEIILPKLVVTT